MFAVQAIQCLRHFYRIEVLTLDVLDQADFEQMIGRRVLDNNGYLGQTRHARRPPATLSGDQLEAVAVLPHDQRLNDSVRFNRLCKLPQSIRLKDRTGLNRVRVDSVDQDEEWSARGFLRCWRGLRHHSRPRGEERSESFTQ